MARLKIESELSLDGRQFFAVMRTAEGVGQGFASSFKNAIASAFTVSAITRFAAHLLDTANNWEDVADQIGTSIENVQELEAAFRKSGLTAEASVAAALQLSRAIDDAKRGGPALDAFSRLGISAEELVSSGDDVVSVMRRVADEIKTLDRVSQREIARQLFTPKAGEKFLAALQEFREQGPIPIVDPADVDRISQMKKDLDEIKRRATGAALGSAAGRVNPLTPFIGTGSFIGGAIARFFGIGKGRATTGPSAFGAFGAAAGAGLSAGTPTGLGPKGTFTVDPGLRQFQRHQDFLEKQAALEEKIFQIQQKMLPLGQQRLALESRISEKLRESEALAAKGDQPGAFAAAQEAAGFLDQLAGLRRDPTREPRLNQLQQIGGGGGDIADRLLNPAQQQLNKMDLFLRELQNVHNTLRERLGDQL